MGDKINIQGDAIGSAVGRDAKVKARDLTVFKQAVGHSALDSNLKQALKDARDLLEAADLPEQDKADAVDDLNKLSEELQKPEKDPGRVQRYLNRIKEIAAPVASILTSVATIAKLIGTFRGH